jgi:hypothetical protein
MGSKEQYKPSYTYGGRAIVLEVDGLEGAPVRMVLRPRQVEIDDDVATGTTKITAKRSKIMSMTGDLRGVFERIAPAEFPTTTPSRQFHGRLWAVHMKPKDKMHKHMMLTYTSSDGNVYTAANDALPGSLQLVATEKEVEELREMGSQFEIVEVSLQGDTVEGHLEALRSEIGRLLEGMDGNDIDVETFDELTNRADLFVRTLRREAETIEDSVAKVGTALVEAQKKKADARRRKKKGKP